MTSQRPDRLHGNPLPPIAWPAKELRLNAKVAGAALCLLSVILACGGQGLANQVADYVARPFHETGGGTTPTPSKREDQAVRVVVIDPGHGGDDIGALGPTGLEERTVTLEVALRLRDLIVSGLGCQAILTRERDENIPLANRTGLANHHKANLFLSIHTNAHFTGMPEGFTSYTFGSGGPDEGRRALADKPTPRVVSSPKNSWATGQLPHLGGSALLAELIQTNVARSGLARDQGTREKPLLLLEGAQMPAVLVEIGFITNHEEELKLKSGPYLERIAELLFQSVKDYFEAQRWYAQ